MSQLCDGELDFDQILNPSRDIVLSLEDVGITVEYYVVAALYMEGGGQFQSANLQLMVESCQP